MSISSFLTKKFLKSLFFPAHNRGAALPKKLVKLLQVQQIEILKIVQFMVEKEHPNQEIRTASGLKLYAQEILLVIIQ